MRKRIPDAQFEETKVLAIEVTFQHQPNHGSAVCLLTGSKDHGRLLHVPFSGPENAQPIRSILAVVHIKQTEVPPIADYADRKDWTCGAQTSNCFCIVDRYGA